jgi:hypothetical protein
MSARTAASRLEVDQTFGGIYAGASFDLSPAVVDHLNTICGRASGLLPTEFRPFAPGALVTISIPTVPMERRTFLDVYSTLHARIDGELDLVLADHPRLYSSSVDDPDLIRAVPTFIPKTVFPDGFFGRGHNVEILSDDVSIFGPVERMFHTQTSGALFSHIEDAPGRLVLEVRGNLQALAAKGQIVFFTDPAFGEPVAVTQVFDDGLEVPLDWTMLGRDRVGDAELFHEWIAHGVRPRGAVVVIEVHLPRRGQGLAAALYSGHTRDTAFRADAVVL